MKKLTLILLAFVVLAGPCVAASLYSVTEGNLPSKANWVFHADFEMFNRSTIGKLIRAELKEMGLEDQLAGFVQIFDFHPLDDTRNVTICGEGAQPSKAAAMLQGRFNPERLSMLVASNPSYNKFDYQGYSIHSWIDEKKPDGPRQYGCFYKQDTLLIGMGKSTVENILDIMDERSYDIEYKADLVDFATAHEGLIVLAAADNVREIAKGLDEPGLLTMVKRLAVAVGEDDSTAYIDMTVQADSSENALKVSQTLQGLIAFASLSMQEQLPDISKLAAKITVTSQDDVVRVHFNHDSKGLIDILKKLAELKKAEEKAAASTESK